MREENINFRIILRVALALLPALLGLTTPALIICAYDIAFSLILFGQGTCVIASLSAVLLSMLYCGLFGASAQMQGLFLGIEAVLCGVACGYSVTEKKNFYFGMWAATFGFLLPSCVNLYLVAGAKGQSVADFLTSSLLHEMRIQIDNVLVQAGLESGAFDSIINTIGKIIVMSIPSILVITSLIVGYIIMWIVCFALRKTPLNIKHSFSEIILPKAVPIFFIFAVVSSVLLSKADELYIGAALNSVIILGSLCDSILYGFFGSERRSYSVYRTM